MEAAPFLFYGLQGPVFRQGISSACLSGRFGAEVICH
jgi:hypothetical protein